MPIIFEFFHQLKDYDYFQIDASDFDNHAHIEFGTNREKEKWVIIFAGWRSTKTRISERELKGNRWIELEDKKLYSKHTENEWKSVRLLESLKFLFCSNFILGGVFELKFWTVRFESPQIKMVLG